MITLETRKTGKDQRIGKYVEGGLFAGYTKCEHCNVDLKVVLRVHEVRELSAIAGIDRKRTSWKVRIADAVTKWARDVKMREATRG